MSTEKNTSFLVGPTFKLVVHHAPAAPPAGVGGEQLAVGDPILHAHVGVQRGVDDGVEEVGQLRDDLFGTNRVGKNLILM